LARGLRLRQIVGLVGWSTFVSLTRAFPVRLGIFDVFSVIDYEPPHSDAVLFVVRCRVNTLFGASHGGRGVQAI